ncbi:hypothetical protein EYC80_005689 [Monilinia laxa]|uniref:Uncharacterized protein n=1 Tax=Monilinia laxa TaxID=61186 RepID=A0A5N6KEN7_MONLA|nr:hypothetical protein EYC80_005689 [Monilinia laxa]
MYVDNPPPSLFPFPLSSPTFYNTTSQPNLDIHKTLVLGSYYLVLFPPNNQELLVAVSHRDLCAFSPHLNPTNLSSSSRFQAQLVI